MALLKAGPVASVQVFTAQVFHYSDITCPFIQPQQPLLKGTFSLGLSARDWCLRYWSNGGSFLSFCSILSSQGRNRAAEQVTWCAVCCPRQCLCGETGGRGMQSVFPAQVSGSGDLKCVVFLSWSFTFFCFNFAYFITPNTNNFLLTW